VLLQPLNAEKFRPNGFFGIGDKKIVTQRFRRGQGPVPK
jgi:hypothetical protein